mmetsp:Transcript_30130/g.55065  ORF Transcript_30130/g.55065 Transcript_30130/m.55065 type:complete len:161 (-) Transcript_30130:682-1164(-)
MPGVFDQIKVAVGVQEQEEKGLVGQIDEATTMSLKTRLIGCGVCLALGVLMTIISMPMLWGMKFTQFGVLYSFGSIVSVGSTCFLMGPIKQIKRMFEQKRMFATIAYLGSIVATLVVAFTLHNAGVCLVFVLIQIAALAWYILTWIPGGTSLVSGMISKS